MFGRDVYISTLVNLLQPNVRYLDDSSTLLSVQILREACMLAAVNLKNAGDRLPNKVKKINSKI